MSVHINEAGIDCGNCGYCVVTKTRKNAEDLASELEWVDGDPLCPDCGQRITFEDYIEAQE